MLKETMIKVPEKMAPYINTDDPREELERNALLLYPYIRNNTMSHGKVAAILGVSKWDLIEIYDSLGFPYLSSKSDFADDLRTIAKLEKVAEK